MVVDLVDVRVGAELAPQVDGGERFDRDLRGQRQVAEHVADVEAPRRGERDGEDLQGEQAVEREQLRQPLATREEERGLLAADGDDGHDRHVLLEREPQEALAPAEVDAPALPDRPVDLVVAAGYTSTAAPASSALRALSCEAATVPYLRRKERNGIESTRLWASWWKTRSTPK